MFIKQKGVQSSYNLFFKKYLYTVDEKKYTYTVKGKKINSSEIFPIVYSLFWLHHHPSIHPSPSPSTSSTDFLHVAIYYSWLGQSSILSLSSTFCIMHCIIFHIVFYRFLNKEAPTFKSINNINKCIKYPFPIILKYKIKIIPKRKKMESEHSIKLNHTIHC